MTMNAFGLRLVYDTLTTIPTRAFPSPFLVRVVVKPLLDEYCYTIRLICGCQACMKSSKGNGNRLQILRVQFSACTEETPNARTLGLDTSILDSNAVGLH